MNTQGTPKQEETASPTSFISLFSCCSREKPKYMSGRGQHLNHWNEAFPLLDRALSTPLEKILKPYQ